MSFLYALWLISLLFSAIALLIMIALILGRLVTERRARAAAAERRRHVALLLSADAGGAPAGKVAPASDLLTDVFTELIGLVRGSEKDNFLASSAHLGIPERLRRRLDTGSPRVRVTAAEALAHFPDEASVQRLRTALGDPNGKVRLAAALALAANGHAPSVDAIVRTLEIGTRENSLLTIGLFRDIADQRPQDIRTLIATTDVTPAVKAAAIDALAQSGDYSLVPVISALVLAPGAPLREVPRYLAALGELGHPAAAEAVAYGLASDDIAVRAAAAQAAGKIGLIDLADRLSALLGDGRWLIRFRAAEALARMGEAGRAVLRREAAQAGEPARSSARLILAEQGFAS